MAENNRKKIQLYRNYQLGAVANDIDFGELALNYNPRSPFIMFKDNAGDIQKIGALSSSTGSSIYHTMTQKAITDALSSSNTSSVEQFDKIEASIGLATDGSYKKRTDSNYINNSTTVVDGINLLDKALKTEENARIAQDDKIEGSIGLNADGSYEQRVDSNYINGATTVVGAINTLDIALKSEESNRIAQDDKIENSIGLKEDGSYNKVYDSNYINASTSIVSAIDLLDDALKSEENARIAQDDKIEGSIGLNADGSYEQRTNSHYINDATTIVSAIDTLDVSLKSEENARIAQDNRIEESIGLSADGFYVKRVDSNYINNANTIVEAIDLLDKEAKDSSDAIDAIEEFIGMGNGESAIPVADQISNAINTLDVNTVGGTGFYIDSIKEENGLIIPTSKVLVEPNDHVLTYTDSGITSTISIAKLTESEVLNLGESNVKEAYKLISKGNHQLGDTIKIYKDQSLQGVTYENQILTFTYILSDGTTETVDVNISEFITEAEYGDGLKVVNHKVSTRLGEDTATNKNFLDLEESGGSTKALAVRSVDTDRTYTTEEITVMGGPLAKLLTDVGINKIDAGTDIQSLLMTLLCKEIYPYNATTDSWYMLDEAALGNQKQVTYSTPRFSNSINIPSVSNFTTGTVEAGTKFTFTVSVPSTTTSSTSSKVDNLTWGYSAADDDSADSTATSITKTWSSSISNDVYTLKTTVDSGFGGISKANVTGTNASKPSYSLEVQVADGTNKITWYVTGCTYTGTLPVNPSVYMVSNLGKTDAAIKTNVIASATTTPSAPTNSTNKTVTGDRYAFYGTKTSTLGVGNMMTLNSANVRGLGGKTFDKTFSITVPNGTTHVYIALPSDRTLTKVADKEAFGTDIVASFKANTNTNIPVEGANGYTSQNYTVYVYCPDTALGANTYDVTLS